MHAPDGFLTAGTAVATGVISAGTVGYVLNRSKELATETALPLAGVMAAFIFAAQMINVPVAAGTTGHLLGGTLAAVLLGPFLAVVVMTVVVGVQALAFADGGITALGYNLLTLAIIAPLSGYGLLTAIRRFLPRSRSGLAASAGLAAAGSVVLTAAGLAVLWLFGASAPIPFDRVLAAMVGAHTVVAVGEGVVTAMIVSAVLAARPDLVAAARGVTFDEDPTATNEAATTGPGIRVVAAAGALAATVLALVVSPFAASDPDGLERFIENNELTFASNDISPLSDYAVNGLSNPVVSLIVAASVGLILVLSVTSGLVAATTADRQRS